MQFRPSLGVGLLAGVLLLIGAGLGVLTWHHPELLGIPSGSTRQIFWISVITIVTFIGVMFPVGYHFLGSQLGRSAYRQIDPDDVVKPVQMSTTSDLEAWEKVRIAEIKAYLREHYGAFWRHKLRLLLVVGQPDQIEAIVPSLKDKHWLVGQDTVLLWGGSVQSKPDEMFVRWQGLSPWRVFDGVIWALNKEQSVDIRAMAAGVQHVKALARRLRWQLPLHLWQVCDSQWKQDKRPAQPVGCLLATRVTATELDTCLRQLLEPLRRAGLAQVNDAQNHDFLLRVSRDLQAEGIGRWRQVLGPLFGQFALGVPLRGLWFSLPTPPTSQGADEHHWPMDPAWTGVLGDKASRHRRLGWSTSRIAFALMLSLSMLWGAGLLLSFISNRLHIAQVQAALVSLEQSQGTDEQLSALNEVVRELARLDFRSEHGVPWYQRFGLSHNQPLLDALWPAYIQANHRLLRDPAAADLRHQLQTLINLPPDSAERGERSREAYDQLKAYLMMARPEKVDATFLARTLGEAQLPRADVSPELWQFYTAHLPTHPAWQIKADARLVAQVRQVLLGQLGQRNAEASLYQKVLDSAANHYPALGLAQMVGDTDSQALFFTGDSVPGVFTRKAWEGQVRQAIDEIAEVRREEIDWVLSENHADIAAELTPDQLRERLIERYFRDYANAWLDFLNSLRWQEVDSLGEVIDQLALMSDVRQSPLIALMNTLAWQGQAGIRGEAFTDSLIKSAQKLISQDKVPAIDQQADGPGGPLDATFGPLLSLLGKDVAGKNANDRLSLHAFLNRVTRVRLKLQQVSNAPNPQEMTRALAQSVFQGKNVDLTETQSYGSLVAASLGTEWDGVGQTLFVQPLEQAWQRVLQPSAAGLNGQWQRAILSEWNSAFTGRYPFAATASDASLPMLGQMIRAESGRIDQFLQQQLGGVLRKEGSRWVADSRHSQGLRFNPQFLAAINQLSHLADVLYTDGGMGMSFELQGKPVRDVVQTTFILNGEKHHYFNQKESWQRFYWPGFSNHPGTSLSWTSIYTGERLFGDYQGTWGLIRLLEKARVTALNGSESQFRVQLGAPDGLELTWNLRTELGAGPLALLKLRNFKLPAQIFIGNSGKAVPYAQNGSFE